MAAKGEGKDEEEGKKQGRRRDRGEGGRAQPFKKKKKRTTPFIKSGALEAPHLINGVLQHLPDLITRTGSICGRIQIREKKK